jgi:transposase
LGDFVMAGDDLEELAGSASTDEALDSPPPAARKRRHRRPPATEKEWYSKAEAARYLGVAEITVTRYLAAGKLRAQRLPTPGPKPGSNSPAKYDYGRLRIHREELDRYLESIDRNASDPARPTSVDPGATARRDTEANSDPSAGLHAISLPDPYGGEVITREEAATRLGVSWRTIKRYIESGKLRLAGYYRCSDSYTRAHVYRSEVDELLQSDQRMCTSQVQKGQAAG